MEKVIGPINGCYAVIVARKVDGKFRASYKVCASAPADYRSAAPLRHRRLSGLSDTPIEAIEIAEQLVRLHIARLEDEDEARAAAKLPRVLVADFDSSMSDETPGQRLDRLYAPTELGPLYMSV
jgi:hypothetical protein